MKVRTNADSVLQYDVIGLTATEMGAILAYLRIAADTATVVGRYATEANDIADRLLSASDDNDYGTQYREVPAS